MKGKREINFVSGRNGDFVDGDMSESKKTVVVFNKVFPERFAKFIHISKIKCDLF